MEKCKNVQFRILIWSFYEASCSILSNLQRQKISGIRFRKGEESIKVWDPKASGVPGALSFD